ncbi:DUF732 domain-containing protein [Mycobacterium intermedium]|uniref:DUF732 domain-containing protein n=1 Tax=Mycobacterium intermedium TaxID=28445 RepID=UPI0021F33F26|nr:DUF732 domain-containing protein [Mycobacterium intermedium]
MAIATLMLMGAAILHGSSAKADPNQDEEFLASLARQGIPALENAQSLIPVAHQVCGELSGGTPAEGVVESMTAFAYEHNPEMREYPRDRITRTFSRFVTAAVHVYCPANQGKIGSLQVHLASLTVEPSYPAAAYPHGAIASQGKWRKEQRSTPSRMVSVAHPMPVGASVASNEWVQGAEGTPRSGATAPVPATFAAGETVAPKPPEFPTPPPPVNILRPPQAPAPSQAPRQTPPPPSQVPPPPPSEVPPPPQQPPPTPKELPPPQQAEPPAAPPEPGGAAGGGGIGEGGIGSGGAGSGGTGGSGGASGGNVPAEPPPTRSLGPGIIQIAP